MKTKNRFFALIVEVAHVGFGTELSLGGSISLDNMRLLSMTSPVAERSTSNRAFQKSKGTSYPQGAPCPTLISAVTVSL